MPAWLSFGRYPVRHSALGDGMSSARGSPTRRRLTGRRNLGQRRNLVNPLQAGIRKERLAVQHCADDRSVGSCAETSEYRAGTPARASCGAFPPRSGANTSELQSLMSTSYAVLCFKTTRNEKKLQYVT